MTKCGQKTHSERMKVPDSATGKRSPYHPEIANSTADDSTASCGPESWEKIAFALWEGGMVVLFVFC